MTIQHTTHYSLPYPQLSDPAQVPADIQALAVAVDSLVDLFERNYVPIGSLSMWAGAAAPSRWALCDGSLQDQIGTFASLFAVIGSNFNTGTVPAGKFCLPDLRGRAPVGIDGAAARIAATPDALGQAGGEERHALLPAESAVRDHKHSGNTANELTSLSHAHGASSGGMDRANPHSHPVGNPPQNPGFAGWAASRVPLTGSGGVIVPANNNYANGVVSNTFTTDINHLHGITVNAGGPAAHKHALDTVSQAVVGGAVNGAVHNNMQPYQIVNFIIRYL